SNENTKSRSRNQQKSRPHRAAFLLEGVADFDLTGAPQGGQRPTQRGRKQSNPEPKTKYKNSLVP
ncbi:hypothetical protein, partial [Roseibium denhamense]|uniref:hypothetical protein n=1 Tax=Roseibium denhamense TaxID=76305 RepID=UPI001AD924C9